MRKHQTMIFSVLTTAPVVVVSVPFNVRLRVCFRRPRGQCGANEVAPGLDGTLLGENHGEDGTAANHSDEVREEALAVVLHKELARLLGCQSYAPFLHREDDQRG